MRSDGELSEHGSHRPEAPHSQLYVEAAACDRPVESAFPVSRCKVCVSKVQDEHVPRGVVARNQFDSRYHDTDYC